MTTWLKYIIETSRNKHRVNIKYIEEYIPKLHIHQHSLLTRKVFFRHNFSALVFFSASTGTSSSLIHLHLQVIFVFKSSGSGLSLDLDHHKMASLDLDHHSIWISQSHHNWIWIIARSRSPLVIIMWILSRHRKFYRASPFSCWMYYLLRDSPFSY